MTSNADVRFRCERYRTLWCLRNEHAFGTGSDRFGLKFHTETKQGPVYELMVDRSGVKMKSDGDVGNLNIPIIPSGPAQFVGTKVPIAYLCWFLGQQMRNDPRPVIDKTGLTLVYDFTLDFLPELPPWRLDRRIAPGDAEPSDDPGCAPRTARPAAGVREGFR
jgi:uncharacterized protein (TIGR03435 family)